MKAGSTYLASIRAAVLSSLLMTSSALADGSYVFGHGELTFGYLLQKPISTFHPVAINQNVLIRRVPGQSCLLAQIAPIKPSSQSWISMSGEGASGPVNFTVADHNTSICGFVIGPPVLSGVGVTIRGSNYSDTLLNLSTSQVLFHGLEGDDIIWNTFSRAFDTTFGEGGQDLFILTNQEWATGEEGNDLFCTLWGETAGVANGDGCDWGGGPCTDGSSNDDELCGAGQTRNIEHVNTNCSCF